jgi:hypothetical protein
MTSVAHDSAIAGAPPRYAAVRARIRTCRVRESSIRCAVRKSRGQEDRAWRRRWRAQLCHRSKQVEVQCGRDRQNARSRDHETKGCTPGSLDEARYRWPNCFEERKNAEAEERLRRRYLLSGNAERKLALMTIVTGCNKSVRRAAVALVTRIPLRSHRDADYHMLLSLRFKGAVSLLRSFRRSGDLNFSINKITGDRVRSGSDKRKMES